MKRYNEYKDSGVDWIGEIPSHWEVKKFKYILDMIVDNRGKTPPIEDTGIPLLEIDSLYGENYNPSLRNVSKFISQKTYDTFLRKYLEEGDILFATVGSIGKIAIVPQEFNYCIAQNIVGFRVIKDCNNSRYWMYTMMSEYFKKMMMNYNKGNIQDSIKISDLVMGNVIVPSKKEQDKISNYLDKKTSQIEKLISKKEELIETLKASRTKLISETVTKGLDKDVPMKDSGIEWIGEIPSHYEIKKLKNLCNHIGRGKSPEYEENTGYYTINQACLYWTYFKSENIKSVSSKFYNSLNRNQKISKGDILINSTGGGNLGKSAFFDKTGTLGRVHFYEGDEKYAYDSHVTMVRLKEIYNKKYFYYMFCTKNVHSYIDLFCVNGSTKQIELSKSGLESIIIPIPSKEEQDEIANYLDEKTSQIDSLVATIEEQIEILKKAKQKLITEVVTGKIDVTNL